MYRTPKPAFKIIKSHCMFVELDIHFSEEGPHKHKLQTKSTSLIACYKRNYRNVLCWKYVIVGSYTSFPLWILSTLLSNIFLSYCISFNNILWRSYCTYCYYVGECWPQCFMCLALHFQQLGLFTEKAITFYDINGWRLWWTKVM